LSSGAAASLAASRESAFDWPPGERRKYESAFVFFEMPELSSMIAEELTSSEHPGSLGEAMASKIPELKADLIAGARNNMLLVVLLTCGVVSPARFADQLCSTRTKKQHSDFLIMLESWMV